MFVIGALPISHAGWKKMEENGNAGLAWYAVRTRSKQEFKVRDQLTEMDIENFLPLVEKRRKWSDRQKLVTFPLFSGYCFSRFFLRDCLQVLKVRGVVEILGNSGTPVSIPDEEIEGVRQLVTSKLPHDPHPNLEKGSPVEVIHGPLTGLRGTMVRKGSRARFVISVTLIGQGVSVELDAEDLVPVS